MSDASAAPAPDPRRTDPDPFAPPRRAVVLARGLGTRMRREDDAADLTEDQAQIAASGVKALIDVGRPFLDYVLSVLADVGITEVCLVIGPEHDALRDYADRLDGGRLRVTTAVQEEPRGTADAVAAARGFAGGERVIVLNSDNYYPRSALAALTRAPGSALVGFERAALIERSNIPPERIRAFAVVRADRTGTLTDILEKPTEEQLADFGEDAPVSMNAWLFTPAIFDACARVEPSARGELEVMDAVRLAMDGGERFTVVPAAAGVLDMSSRADIGAVAGALADVEVRL
ncbi:MAG: nucleotidyltransferase family protein [Brachybacterium sp.]|nr:nucleotidyltransferase family protein [Brachybacterium sp.]